MHVKVRLLSGAVALAAACALLVWGFLPASGADRPTVPGPDTDSLVKALSTASGGPPSTAKMNLVLDATFRGSKLDTSMWATCYTWAAGDPARGCSNSGNKEYQWYLPGQVRVDDGVLHLVAQKARTEGFLPDGAPKIYGCRSGMVTSFPGFHFKYGYLEVSAKVPNGRGLWPALWLAAANKKWPPEIDLLEHWGAPKNTTAFYYHPAPVTAGTAFTRYFTGGIPPGWHTFAVSWTASYVTWYVDGRPIMTVTQNIPHQSMYFIADLATFKGTTCNGTLAIRWVKAWTW